MQHTGEQIRSEKKKPDRSRARALAVKIANWILVIATGVTAVWIMANHLGLQDSLDFGAGAYYYADIPKFQRFVGNNVYHTSVPSWLIFVLFLAWGALMYRFWVWVDERLERK